MNPSEDDLRRERLALADLRARVTGREYRPRSGTRVVLGQVFALSAVPLSTGVYFAMRPVVASGTETEGGSGVLTVDTSTYFFAFMLGPQAPRAGETFPCFSMDWRWVAERMKLHTTTITISGCPCTGMVSTLHMTASQPTQNNGNFQSSSLVWTTPKPSWMAGLGIADPGAFLSPSTFTEGAGTFYYYFGCQGGYYCLFLLDPATGLALNPNGTTSTTIAAATPWYKWLIGVPGNTCVPFIMAHGQMFAGGTTSDVVNITQ